MSNRQNLRSPVFGALVHPWDTDDIPFRDDTVLNPSSDSVIVEVQPDKRHANESKNHRVPCSHQPAHCCSCRRFHPRNPQPWRSGSQPDRATGLRLHHDGGHVVARGLSTERHRGSGPNIQCLATDRSGLFLELQRPIVLASDVEAESLRQHFAPSVVDGSDLLGGTTGSQRFRSSSIRANVPGGIRLKTSGWLSQIRTRSASSFARLLERREESVAAQSFP